MSDHMYYISLEQKYHQMMIIKMMKQFNQNEGKWRGRRGDERKILKSQSLKLNFTSNVADEHKKRLRVSQKIERCLIYTIPPYCRER